ncbi:MAG: universal stress protein [Armatimonadetes bacterium]|nr:universal stress protein [Armatimonadota bacterium]
MELLVPMDFSPLATQALACAASFARRFRGRVHVVHVVAGLECLSSDEWRDEGDVFEWARASFDRLTPSLEGVEHVLAIRVGSVSDQVAIYGSTRDIDLIVTASRRRRGLLRLLSDGVTEPLLRDAPCPVLTVAAAAATGPVGQPWLQKGDADMMDIKRILVPTDFSEDSRHALAHGLELARSFGATVHLLHVVDLIAPIPPYAALGGAGAAPPDPLVEDARFELNDLAAEVQDVPLKTVVRIGNAAHQIVDYVKQMEIDLIVIATHGRRGLSRLLLGSTTERVVRTADCAVLSVRHPERCFIKLRPEAQPPVAS